MTEEIKRLEELLKKYQKKYGLELFYDFFIKPEIYMRLMYGPIKTGGILGALAEEMAKKYGLEIKTYDFSRGDWSKPRNYREVLSIVMPDDESEFESTVIKLYEAVKEMNEAVKRLYLSAKWHFFIWKSN